MADNLQIAWNLALWQFANCLKFWRTFSEFLEKIKEFLRISRVIFRLQALFQVGDIVGISAWGLISSQRGGFFLKNNKRSWLAISHTRVGHLYAFSVLLDIDLRKTLSFMAKKL